MNLQPISIDIEEYPAAMRPYLRGASLYDSSCSPEARVIFVDRDEGLFLKTGPAVLLDREYAMTRYVHELGWAARVVEYVSDGERSWLLTEKVPGGDCAAATYLEQPARLCDALAERLALLHALDPAGCPVPDHTQRYLEVVERNHRAKRYDATLFPDNWGYADPDEAYAVVEANRSLLRTDTLLHGDYCLPNVIFDHWEFSGFVDLGNGGVGDAHVDLFWGAWTLTFNLKTDAYCQRFFDAYGRDKVDEEKLRLVAACEVFG